MKWTGFCIKWRILRIILFWTKTTITIGNKEMAINQQRNRDVSANTQANGAFDVGPIQLPSPKNTREWKRTKQTLKNTQMKNGNDCVFFVLREKNCMKRSLFWPASNSIWLDAKLYNINFQTPHLQLSVVRKSLVFRIHFTRHFLCSLMIATKIWSLFQWTVFQFALCKHKKPHHTSLAEWV